MKKYVLASEEGVERFGSEGSKVGDEVSLELDANQEQALIAAAWLAPTKKKEG